MSNSYEELAEVKLKNGDTLLLARLSTRIPAWSVTNYAPDDTTRWHKQFSSAEEAQTEYDKWKDY